MKRFRYFGLEVVDQDVEEHPYYCEFRAELDGKVLVHFYTNRLLKGMWRLDTSRYEYFQTSGTYKFELPNSKSGIRRVLRRMAEQALES